ncbi:CBS domain containing protein [Nitzschia inconspicua]|uniref:CBS domain containing protein n=1 Tax=Nitzschia inconspicua TaxID=303405 RepID=A0A9K3PN49_9STRA|nr:CBS domain containing protein [Nitzschia inconspicua]
MLSRFAPLAARSVRPVVASRTFSGTLGEAITAGDAAELSGYSKIDFTISEEAMVIDAVQKFAAFNIGCLVTTNSKGDLTGIISERDYISKIALLGRTSKDTKVKEIATQSSKLVTVKPEDPVQMCMEKMLNSDIRHLPLVNDKGELRGMISIKDLVKTTIKEKEQTIKVLSDFALGKGGVYGSE